MIKHIITSGMAGDSAGVKYIITAGLEIGAPPPGAQVGSAPGFGGPFMINIGKSIK